MTTRTRAGMRHFTLGRETRTGTAGRRAAARLFALLAFTLLAAWTVGASSAFGAETRPFESAFGPDGTEATHFEAPGPLAVDQATHDVYVGDFETGTVSKFDENGQPVDFEALGTNELTGFSFFAEEALTELAVDSSAHTLYVEDYGSQTITAFKANGEPMEFTAGPAAGTNELGGFGEVCGVAVDGNGVIYAGDYGNSEVDVFAPDGEELTSFSAPEVCNLAVDSHGAVYAATYIFAGGTVERYAPSIFPVTSATTYGTGTVIDPGPARAIAVDPSTDDLFVDHGDGISEYGEGGEHVLSFAEAGELTASEGLAVGASTDRVYVSDREGERQVAIFGPPSQLADVTTGEAEAVIADSATLHGSVDPAGSQLTGCFFEYGPTSSYGETAPCVPAAASIPPDSAVHQVTAEITGLTPASAYHYRLVASTLPGTSHGGDRTLTAIGLPVIDAQSVSAVGSDEATLNAEINPEGAATTYRVEYGATAAYGQSTPAGAPIGAPGDASHHRVSFHLEGLQAGGSYHFRFVAMNAAGPVDGADQAFSTYGAPAVAPCPNDAFRPGSGATLPDCRAYEQVSPVDKLGGRVNWAVPYVEASASGERFTFADASNLPTSGGTSSPAPFLATRAGGTWSTDGLLPPTASGYQAEPLARSDDLASFLAIVPGPPASGLYLREATNGTQRLVVPGVNEKPYVTAFAADSSHFIFESKEALASGAVANASNVYDLDHGSLTLVSRVPAFPATSCDDAGGPSCVAAPGGGVSGPYAWERNSLTDGGGKAGYITDDTISADGSKVFFTELGSGRLFMREDGSRTIQISASQRATEDPNGEKPAAFVGATPDGSKVFFLSCQKLTDDSTASSTPGGGCTEEEGVFPNITLSQGQDLYSYDTGSGKLTDLTVDTGAGDPRGAQVIGMVGSSSDGADVYFVANGVLAPGASPGTCLLRGNTFGPVTCNLYLSRAGGPPVFVAPLSYHVVADETNWIAKYKLGGELEEKSSRVAEDGTLLFTSASPITGFDNHGATELYRYLPGASAPTCVSCDPTGAAPVGSATLASATPIALGQNQGLPHLRRILSADGDRVFFQTPDKLVATDTNGETGCPMVTNLVDSVPSCQDVYEWEAPGSGSCRAAEADDGCLYLISTGRSPEPSYFGDASANGEDVFFFTEQSLVPQDRDQVTDAYDARVEGGLAAQYPGPPPDCSGEACRGPLALPPSQAGAGSAALVGPGNPQRAKDHKKRHHKKHHRHHKKRHHGKKYHKKRHGAERAARDRGGRG